MPAIATNGGTDAEPENPGAFAPLRAIRRECVSCSGGSAHEVGLCPSTRCSLWLFKFGRKPSAADVAPVASIATHPLELPATQAEVASGSRLKAIRRKCLDCSGNNIAEVRRCRHSDCPLHRYRMGKSGRTMSDEQRAAAADRMRRNLASVAQRRLSQEMPDESAVSAECAGSR